MATQLLPDAPTPIRRWNFASPARSQMAYGICILRPPYERGDLQPAPPTLPGTVATPGTIVCVRLSDPRPDVSGLRSVVRDLSRRVPTSPVAILLQMSSEDAVDTAARLAPAGFRAVAPVGASMGSVLRDELTDSAMLARDVLEWIQLRSIRLNPNQVHLLGRIFASAPEHAEVSMLLDHHRFPQSSARFRLRKRGLPSPSRWFQVARGIHAAFRIQTQPEASIAGIAADLGFADHSALAHLVRRCFGVQASAIRGTLGWEWLLHRWCLSNRVLSR